MEITRTPISMHTAFEQSKVTFGVYLAPEADFDDEELNEAICKWANGEDVYMNFRFTVSDCVDDVIELYRHGSKEPVTFSESERGMVDALRSELQAAIAKLDAIQYTAD